MNALERLARLSEPGYLDIAWRAANGDWMTPREDDLRAFLIVLAHEERE